MPFPTRTLRECDYLRICSLYGQNRSAFDKNQPGAWKYDIIAPGIKANMPDISAAIALAQLRQYEEKLLPERRRMFEEYTSALAGCDWAILPPLENKEKISSFHLFMLRIDGADEHRRDMIIADLGTYGIGANVHYIPLPMLSFFKNAGYNINNFPVTYHLYSQEITLPLYNTLRPEQIAHVIEGVKQAGAKR